MLDAPLNGKKPLSPDEQKSRNESGGILSKALKQAEGKPFNELVQQLGSVLQQQVRGKH